MDSFNDSAFDHDEADVTMVSYVLYATRHGIVKEIGEKIVHFMIKA